MLLVETESRKLLRGQPVGSREPAPWSSPSSIRFERAQPAVEIVAYVHRVPGITRAEFHARYTRLGERLRDWGGPAALMCRYAQNHVLGDGDGPDAVGELGFATTDQLTRLLGDPWLFDELLPYEAQFVDHSRTIQMVARRR